MTCWLGLEVQKQLRNLATIIRYTGEGLPMS